MFTLSAEKQVLFPSIPRLRNRTDLNSIERNQSKEKQTNPSLMITENSSKTLIKHDGSKSIFKKKRDSSTDSHSLVHVMSQLTMPTSVDKQNSRSVMHQASPIAEPFSVNVLSHSNLQSP
jgi:hypothetical protein